MAKSVQKKSAAKTAPAPEKASRPKAAAKPEVAEETVPEAATEEPAAEAVNEPITAHDELVDLARTVDANFAPKHAKENRVAYLKRLLMKCSEAEDEAYNSLPKPVQKWFEGAVNAMNSEPEQTIAPLEGFDDQQPAAPAEKPKRQLPEALRKANEARAAARAAAIERGEVPEKKTREPKAPRVKKEKAPKEPRAPGKTWDLWMHVARNPDISGTDLKAFAEKHCPEIAAATISTIRSDGQSMIRALREVGIKI